MKSRKETPFQALSYGIPVLLIARWCHVTEAVALSYKTGRRSPSAAATAIFTLHLNGRVVPDAWNGYHFEGEKLWDPWGKKLTVKQLRAYPIALQLLHAFARGDTKKREAVAQLMGSMNVDHPTKQKNLAFQPAPAKSPRVRVQPLN